MDTYRQLQAQRWQLSQAATPDTVVEELPPQDEGKISIVAVDSTSLDSLKTFMASSSLPRTGILFGTIAEDGYSVVVDAIYECAQDTTTGFSLRDARMPMIVRMNKLMGLRPVGLLITSNEANPTAADLVRLIKLEGAISHVLLMISSEHSVGAVMPTTRCFQLVERGLLVDDTTLTGPTVNGGVDGSTLQKTIAVLRRTVNSIIHCGFYRLNRPNHTPTFDDARAFILARREKAKIDKLHLQLADYHLVLFIADSLGESAAERIILAIFQEEDELVEDLVELILSSSGDL